VIPQSKPYKAEKDVPMALKGLNVVDEHPTIGSDCTLWLFALDWLDASQADSPASLLWRLSFVPLCCVQKS